MENKERNKEHSEMLKHWRAWGSWHSWGSPVGIALGWFLFVVGTGIFLYLLRLSEQL